MWWCCRTYVWVSASFKSMQCQLLHVLFYSLKSILQHVYVNFFQISKKVFIDGLLCRSDNWYSSHFLVYPINSYRCFHMHFTSSQLSMIWVIVYLPNSENISSMNRDICWERLFLSVSFKKEYSLFKLVTLDILSGRLFLSETTFPNKYNCWVIRFELWRFFSCCCSLFH